jgi:hypothetical protein
MYRGSGGIAPRFLIFTIEEVSGQQHALAALSSRKELLLSIQQGARRGAVLVWTI